MFIRRRKGLCIEGGGEGAGSAVITDPGSPPAPDGGNNGLPPANPTPPAKTVPLETLISERRRLQGQIASQQAEITRLSRTTATPPNGGQPATDEERQRQAGRRFYGLDALEEKLNKLIEKATAYDEGIELARQAHNAVMTQMERTKAKVEKFAVGSYDDGIKSIGWTAEQWEGFVASQMSNDDIDECWSNPSHMKEVVKRCKEAILPKINERKTQEAQRIARLPLNPGPGGTPPAPPVPEQPKYGKALHGKAFARLRDRMSEGS